MSNDVYGIIEMKSELLPQAKVFKELAQGLNLGFHSIEYDELYNFPKQYTKLKKSDLAFLIADSPSSKNTTYLVNYVDYAEGADIGLPLKGEDRLDLLVQLIHLLFSECAVERIFIAITDSSEIEEVKEVKLPNINDVLYSDFEEFAPPCVLYIIDN